MKKVLRPFAVVAMLAVTTLAASNVENPLYAPAQFGFYSKTGFGWMYKKSDDNDAMKAKNWANETENPIWRIYEDLGFGITNWLAIRGAFGYTVDGDIDRSGPHNARLGLNFRAINKPVETVVWDIYADAWLGGVSKMKAELVGSKDSLGGTYPLSFNYENYGNGRWGMWFGTMVGKTFDKFTVSAFGEAEVTFGNNNNEIKINKSAKPVIQGMVAQGVYAKGMAENMPAAIVGVCQQYNIPQANCNRQALGDAQFDAIEAGARTYLDPIVSATPKEVAETYREGLPDDFSVDTKGTWDFAAGLKALYEINSAWSVGGGFNWKHRATNSVEALNITNNSSLPPETKDAITKSVADSFVGSMEDGVDEFAISLLGSRQITDNLQLTIYGEYTFDTAEEKAQLGTNRKAEMGLRMNWQF